MSHGVEVVFPRARNPAMRRVWVPLMFLSALLTLGPRATPADESAKAKASAGETTLRFEVTLAKGLLEAPTDGRLLVVLGRGGVFRPS